MSRDRVERTVDEWRSAGIDIDVMPSEIVLRALLLGRTLEQRIARSLEPFGLHTWEFDVLAALRRQNAPYRLPAGELARRVVMTCSGMTHRVTRLEERGLVSREADKGDKRLVLVRLTEAGTELLAANRRRRDAWLNKQLRGLSPEEREALRRAAPVLEKLARS
jgi:DNA-binding MarR family transcriptional regulator